MGWFKAIFDKSDEGTRELIRISYKRRLAHSSLPTARARAIASAGSALEGRWSDVDGYDFESGMFEALPFAMLGDDVPDALAEYVIVRENLLEHMLEGGNLDTGAPDWLIYQTNKGMKVLLNDEDPQLVNTREWLIEAWPERFAQWKGWLDNANRARMMELMSESVVRKMMG